MIYEFRCPDCEVVEEVIMTLSEFEYAKKTGRVCITRLKPNEKCYGLRFPIVSLGSFQLKGNCWEKDGYK